MKIRIKKQQQTYIPAPEGNDIFQISRISYDADKNRVTVWSDMLNASRKHVESFNIDNDFRAGVLGDLLVAALDDPDLETYDEATLEEAEGCQFEAEITHREWDGKTIAGFDPRSFEPVSRYYDFGDSIHAIS